MNESNRATENRVIISCFDKEFARLHSISSSLLDCVSAEKLYLEPANSKSAFPVNSFGEHILRSAAAVEQTFGGITANLWDDPFEWTLPESLSTVDAIRAYLFEVEATRRRGFELFKNDSDLQRRVSVPSRESTTLAALLTTTLARSARQLGEAVAILRLVSADVPLSRL